MTNKDREVYASVWEFIKYLVKEEEASLGDLRHNSQMQKNIENKNSFIKYIDDHLQPRTRKKRKSIKSYCFHSGSCDGCDTDEEEEEEKVCCYPGKNCRCCDTGTCDTCCFCA